MGAEESGPLFRRRGKVVFRVMFLLFSSVFQMLFRFLLYRCTCAMCTNVDKQVTPPFCVNPVGSAHRHDRKQWRTDNRAAREDGGQTLLSD